jgi:hypothetical protein
MDLVELSRGKWRVHLAGKNIGEISLRHLGRHRREFYRAEALDGCELGYFPALSEAHTAVLADEVKGCPRDPHNPSQRLPDGWQASR